MTNKKAIKKQYFVSIYYYITIYKYVHMDRVLMPPPQSNHGLVKNTRAKSWETLL